MKNLPAHIISVILVSFFSFSGCSEDEALNPKAGTLVLKITDAASDDADIKGIFITVTGVKINGKPVRGFTPQTFEISALRDGKTKLLFDKELPAKEYEQVSVVLSSNHFNDEYLPGCYVLKEDNTKHNLFTDSSPEIEIPILKRFELLPGKETNLVIDFDLRKAITRNTDGISDYCFVSKPELEHVVRIVNEEYSGNITGEVTTIFSESTNIYVLLYRKGEFKASTEGTGSGKSNILFVNAVSSTLVEDDGRYHLSFIEEGEYEIRMASFRKNREDVFAFYGFMHTTSKRTGILLNNISVMAGSEIQLNIEVFSLL